MLQKYQYFQKLQKTEECSFYSAVVKQDNQKVLIKKLKYICSWNQMLTCQGLKIESKYVFFPKILQIFKSKGSYFIVYQKPSGENLGAFEEKIKKQFLECYQFLYQICSAIKKLKQQIKTVYIYPQWIYSHRNTLKICHFEPYFSSKDSQTHHKKSNHVFMYNLEHKQNLEQESQGDSGSIRIKNLYFNLGYIAYHLLTQKTTDWRKDLKKYSSKMKFIQSNSKNEIFKITKDQDLSNLVSNLLEIQDADYEFSIQHQCSNEKNIFNKFYNYLRRKKNQSQIFKGNQNRRIVQISLSKMNFFTNQSIIKNEKKKKPYRNCCIKTEDNELCPQNIIQENKFKIIQRNSLSNKRKILFSQQKSSTESKKKLKYQQPISCKNINNRHKTNVSCFLPSVSTERRVSLIQYKKSHRAPSKIFKTPGKIQSSYFF